MGYETSEERDRPAEGGYSPSEKDAGEHVGLEDEIRVQRSEEELRTSTRRRQAGAVRVRKSVHTDHEEFQVPRRREEVEIERLPAGSPSLQSPAAQSQEDPEGVELGEDEMVMRVYEEEIVVTKRLVPKEEIRLRKAVVEEEEFIEEDIRREEVEIDDQSERS